MKRHGTYIFVGAILLCAVILSGIWWIGQNSGTIQQATEISVKATQQTMEGSVKPKLKAVQTNIDDASFVTRSGSSLVLGGKTFRFSGVNIYWLGLQEKPDVSYPSHFRVDDALATASIMGATVVRAHTLGISVGCALCIEPAPGTFNNVAFQHIDYVLQLASVHHIKLIIPLIDNWHYYSGGKHTFTDWRGISDENQFYTDPTVINDFKQYISAILNHKNQYTGIMYRDDPTILAWETGNELSAPFSWVQDTANYIKSLDEHHLIMDGNYDQIHQSTNFLPDLRINALDIYTGHYYPPDIASMSVQLEQTTILKKVFIIGEYDWNTDQGDSLNSFLQAIEQSKAAGDLYWSLFPHDNTNGFVAQNEHFTLHYPGNTPDMRNRERLLYIHAYAMRSLPVPTNMVPGQPFIGAINLRYISWRGAYGADTYSVERSTTGSNGPWTTICNRCASDYTTPWLDTSQPSGALWYRVRAFSLWGVPGAYSNVYMTVLPAIGKVG